MIDKASRFLDRNRGNLFIMIDTAILVALIGVVWTTSEWKASTDARLERMEGDIGRITTQQISPEAARRVDLLELETRHLRQNFEEFKVEFNRRSDRQDQKLDRILGRLERPQ